MDRQRLVAAVEHSLAPAMAARGFGPSGPGTSPDGSSSFLSCIDAQVFAARWRETFELLRAMGDPEDVEGPGRCLDLVVEASPGGEIRSLTFEAVDVDELLRAAHLDALARRFSVDALRGLGADEVVARICEGVDALMPLHLQQR